MINIKMTNTIPYHLRAEGMVEKLVRILLIYVGANQWDWDQHINAVLFSYRTAINESRGESLDFLLYARDTTSSMEIINSNLFQN